MLCIYLLCEYEVCSTVLWPGETQIMSFLQVLCQGLRDLMLGNSPIRTLQLPALRAPPDGCRFEERIRDLKRSLREERRALREADALCRRLAFRRFEQTLLTQPRVFPTKRKQLLVRSALDDTAVIKHENLVGVHDS
jgi:hypothetical protein